METGETFSRCATRIYTRSFIIQHILNAIFFFLKDANLGNSSGDSTLYAYNKNLETVICNLKQECFKLSDWFYYLISFMTTIYGSESRKVSLHVVWRQGE